MTLFKYSTNDWHLEQSVEVQHRAYHLQLGSAIVVEVFQIGLQITSSDSQ